MPNLEFADNAQLRFNETSELPISINNSELYFSVIDQDSMQIGSFNCDVRGLNNLHHALTSGDVDAGMLVLCVWHGQFQSHTFVCEPEVLTAKIKTALGTNFCDELEAGLAY